MFTFVALSIIHFFRAKTKQIYTYSFNVIVIASHLLLAFADTVSTTQRFCRLMLSHPDQCWTSNVYAELELDERTHESAMRPIHLHFILIFCYQKEEGNSFSCKKSQMSGMRLRMTGIPSYNLASLHVYLIEWIARFSFIVNMYWWRGILSLIVSPGYNHRMGIMSESNSHHHSKSWNDKSHFYTIIEFPTKMNKSRIPISWNTFIIFCQRGGTYGIRQLFRNGTKFASFK